MAKFKGPGLAARLLLLERTKLTCIACNGPGLAARLLLLEH